MATQNWTLATVLAEGRRLRNWGRWGADDEIGTLNLITAGRGGGAGAAGQRQPLRPALRRRWSAARRPALQPDPRYAVRGADTAAGAQDRIPGLRYADDLITMPLQCGTQWDGLSHIVSDMGADAPIWD